MLVHATAVECSTAVKTINTDSYYNLVMYFVPYIILSFMQHMVQSCCFEHVCMFIVQRLLVPV